MKIITVIIGVFLVQSIVCSQEKPNVVVFKPEEQSGLQIKEAKNAIKIGVGDMFVGDYCLHYERSVNDFLSWGGGLGITSRIDPRIDPFSLYFIEEVYGNSLIQNNPALSWALNFNFHFDYVFDGSYIGFELKRRVYDWDNLSYAFAESVNEWYNVLYPRINLGYNIVLADRLIFDGFVGIGAARVTLNQYSTFQEEVIETSERRILFHLGLRIGGIF
jgi:hypothetical protein